MPFEKGQSGNPAGRPRGSRGRATMALQDMLERDAESIARTAINLAKHGNIAALRICMDRLLPPRRHEPVTLDLPPLDKVADTVAATSAIVASVAAGSPRRRRPIWPRWSTSTCRRWRPPPSRRAWHGWNKVARIKSQKLTEGASTQWAKS